MYRVVRVGYVIGVLKPLEHLDLRGEGLVANPGENLVWYLWEDTEVLTTFFLTA